jgi:hypothetical protein
LQRFPSAHDVPLVTALVVQPVVGLQPSVVQGLPSLQLSGVPAVHTPLWQVSSPLQTVASAHDEPLATGVFWQPVAGIHVSVVQTLLSLQLSGVPAVQVPLWHVSAPLQRSLSGHAVPFATGVKVHPVAGLHASAVHALLSLQVSGVPEVHVPLWQVSSPLHTLPSVQDEPFATGVLAQPVAALQESAVQALPSSQLSGVPAVQVPLWHVSAPLQRLESEQDVPLATGVLTQPVAGLQESVVQTLLSLQSGGVPGLHVPPWQVSAPLQRLVSAHDVPLATAVFWQTPALHTSEVHGFVSSQSPLTVHGWQPAMGVLLHPLMGLQLSVVHALLSSQLSGVPAVQVPL